MNYIDENKLLAELEAADQAGDTAHAKKIADVINQQRTAFSKSVGFANNNIVNKYGIDGTLEKLKEQGYDYKASDDMSTGERILAGIGRGATDIGQGVKQLGNRAGNLVGLVDDKSVSDYDKKIQQEAQLYDRDLGQTTSGKIGRFIGQTAATAPVGLVAGKAIQGVTGVNNLANAGRVATAGRMGAQGAGIGAVEGAVQPVLNGGDFLSQKLGQTGIGALTGGVIGGAGGTLKAGKEIAEQGVGNTAYQGLANPKRNKILGTVFGDRAESEANRKAAETLGDVSMLTAAERSGGKGAQFLENLAEQSLFTADDVLEKSTIPKMNKFKNAVLRQADQISKANYTPEQMGVKLQQMTTAAGRKLAQDRSRMAEKLYGEIDNMAKGRKIVKLDNTTQVLGEIVNSAKGVHGGDLQKVARQVKKMIPEIDSGMTAKQALRQLQALQPGNKSGSLFKGIEKLGVDDAYKRQLKDALLADMDNVPGGLGDAVRKANNAYRQASDEIEALGFSILGRTAGDELASDVTGLAANAIAPEKVLDSFATAKPSQVVSAMKYMEKFDPNLANDFRAHYLKNAMNEAGFQAASAGASETINPVTFLNALGVKSGKRGIEGMDKLKAIMSGVPNSKQLIDSMVRVAQIKGDSFGRNFSGTAAQNQANQFIGMLGNLWSAVTGGAAKAGGSIGHYAGIKGVARALIDDADNWQPVRLQWSPDKVRQGLAASSAVVTPQAVQSGTNSDN